MAEIYSGLRRRRKRTHPSKCPCCISDEVEPENERSAGNEELHEPNTKKDVGHKQSKRRKTLKKKEDDYNGDSDTPDHAVTEKDEKPNSKRARLRNSRNSSPTNDGQTSKKASKIVVRKDIKNSYNKDENESDKNKIPKNSNNKKGSNAGSGKKEMKGNGKNNILLQKSNVDSQSDEEIASSTLKTSSSKKGGSTDSEISGKKKDKSSKQRTKKPNKKVSEVKSKKNKTQEENDLNSNAFLENLNTKTEKGRKNGNKVSNVKRKGRMSPTNNLQKPKNLIGGNSSPEVVTKQRKSRVKNIVLSSKVSQITQVKNMVFDHLFEELKSGSGNKNLSVKEAGDILMKISAEDLNLAIRSAEQGHGFGHDKRYSIRNTANQHLGEKKVISDTEEIVSQAAEALVSFRTKSPLSRDESKVDNNTKNPVSNQERDPKNCIASSMAQSYADIHKVNPVTTSNFNSSQAAHALRQIQTSSVLSPQIFPTQVTSSPSHNLVQGQGYLPVSLSQQFSQSPQTGITTSFANLMPMVASHGTLPSFSQIAAQLRPSSMQGGLQPPLLNAMVSNPSVQTSSVMLQNQALLQPQIKQTVPVAHPGSSSNKLQVLTTMKSPGPSIDGTANKGPNQNQILPQQPLKGMEEVVGNVGSNVPPIVWSLKSPVVFLGSPQNLGGVPRNLMAASSNQGVNVNPNKEQTGYPPVAPRPGSNTDGLNVGTRMNPGTVSSVPGPNVLTLGGRPILPRTQPRSTDDANYKRQQPIAPQSSLTFVPQQTSVGSSGTFPVQSSTSAVTGQVVATQVTSDLNPNKTNLVSVSLPGTPPQINTSAGNFPSQNIPENTSGDCSSPTSVTAKLAVKKLVHERTKTAELKREASSSANHQLSTKLKTILPSPPKPTDTTTTSSTNMKDNPDTASKNSEFNLEQAATALLSIGVPDGSEVIGLKSTSSETLKEDHEEDVVFTSKGMFRVGDVDVDPHYNRIGREGYTCGKCNKIFTSLSYLARHIKRVCPDMSCRKWKCSLCDKAFRHPFGLQQHVYTHTGERPHKCPICPKAFYSSNDLRRHSRIHSGERPYNCKHCDKSFATTISLKTHTYIHTGEKPHKCPQCPKTFATSSKLGRHIVTHSEQRPYSCEQCPKSFNRSGDLRRHNLAVHEGKEKSFDCDICSMSFTKSADLRRHSTSHHPRPQKTMECGECGTQFSTPICLKMHKETYHKNPTTTTTTSEPEKPCTCDMCGKTYNSASQLAKHKVTHEPTSTAGYDPSQYQHIAPKPIEQAGDTGPG